MCIRDSYERFVDEDLSGNASVSSGRVWWNVLNRERRGDYLGATVQIIPHITGEIKSRVYAMAEEDVDVVIAEIGGTVGDIESQPFLEAIRQIRAERPLGDVQMCIRDRGPASGGQGRLSAAGGTPGKRDSRGRGSAPPPRGMDQPSMGE